jgi:EAL domain-containing protein (putative c-di-GMP-specific phosphodiesterase class I)
VDDFGTGYSSLTYLKRLPAETLKIDQSFVRDMLDDPDDFAIVKGVIGLAKAFHRKVIAEGVETIAHGELLIPLGCELAQGYGIARPMPANELIYWAARWKPDPRWTYFQHNEPQKII